MLIRYMGWKDIKTMQFPLGFIAKGEIELTLDFPKGKPIEVPDQYVEKLLELCGHSFEAVTREATEPETAPSGEASPDQMPSSTKEGSSETGDATELPPRRKPGRPPRKPALA